MKLTPDTYTVRCVHLFNPGVMHACNLVVIHTEWIQSRWVDYKYHKNAGLSSSNSSDRYCLMKQAK